MAWGEEGAAPIEAQSKAHRQWAAITVHTGKGEANIKGLKDKVVIVTGRGGIGSAICRRFAEEGARVAVFDINKDAAEAVASGIRDSGGEARAFAVDLTSQESVIAAVAAAEVQLGPTGGLVNNPGRGQADPFLKTDKPLSPSSSRPGCAGDIRSTSSRWCDRGGGLSAGFRCGLGRRVGCLARARHLFASE